MKRILAIVLTLCMLTVMLAGCSVWDVILSVVREQAGITEPTEATKPRATGSFRDMEYIRPDMEEHQALLAGCCATAKESTDMDEIQEAVNTYYEAYDRIIASSTLAEIYACKDITSSYWQEETAYCTMAAVEADAGLEELYCALALSPMTEELEEEYGAAFLAYYRELGSPDKTLQEYNTREAALVEQFTNLYNQLTPEGFYAEDTDAVALAEILVELIALRQEMADYLDYGSYPQLAYDIYHYRSYTPAQAKSYLSQVGAQMAQLYRETYFSPQWQDGYVPVLSESYTMDYLDSATQAMGGKIREAFDYMCSNELYDITISENKRTVSYEAYILYYNQPYIFTSPMGMRSDSLGFAHEFGHFVNDWLLDPSYVGTDVAEVKSQGMEYLSLFYADNGDALKEYKLLDCLSTYVEQAAFSLFEHRMYELKGDKLTAENLHALFLEIGTAFGLECWQDYNGWEFTTVSHMYTSPMYLMSYVVSNDVAFQLYQKELKEPGSGLAIYEECLESEDAYLMFFLQRYDLEDPLANGRLLSVSRTLEKELAQ